MTLESKVKHKDTEIMSACPIIIFDGCGSYLAHRLDDNKWVVYVTEAKVKLNG